MRRAAPPSLLHAALLLVALATQSALWAPAAWAQQSNATCFSNFSWMDNKEGQNTCLVSAYLISACSIAPFGVPNGTAYPVPGQGGLPTNNCTCSTVVYTTLSACAYCQGGVYPSWSAWDLNCTAGQTSIAKFPVQIPAGTSIPAWAFVSPLELGGFDPTGAKIIAAEGAPDSSSVSSSTSTSTTSSPSSSAPTTAASTSASSQTETASKSSKADVAAIVGGVIGGIVAIGAGAIAVLLVIRCTRVPPAESFKEPSMHTRGPSYTGETVSSRWASSPGGPIITPPVAHRSPGLRLYNPDDPTTFPTPRPESERTVATGGNSHGHTRQASSLTQRIPEIQ